VVEPPGPPPPPPPELPPEPPPPGGEPPPPDPLLCPRCGSPHDAFQEYCLECGIRLPLPPGVTSVRQTMWSRESPLWLWAALASLLLVALIAGAIVAVAATDEEAKGIVVSTNPTTTKPVGVITQPPTFTINPGTTTTAPTTTTLPTTTQPTTTTTGTTTTTTTTGGLTTWPAGKNGFTVVLKSVPHSQGRSAAETEARRAQSQGLPQAGVLNSSNYNSLNPGYWVAFSGVYDTKAQAESNLTTARSRGWPLAYVRRVAR
jgi:hypothetical protein